MNVYEVRPRKDHHGVDLISDALPFGRLSSAISGNCNGCYGFMPARRGRQLARAGKQSGFPRPNVESLYPHVSLGRYFPGSM